jgi:hypothetical protein
MPLFDVLRMQLESRDPLPPLVPQAVWQPQLSQQITTASTNELIPHSSAHNASSMADACRAGLLLWNDDLDASHTIAQGLENPTGSYWHAIMHRREGDYSNSNYWWRRTGTHPAFPAVYAAALATLENEKGDAQLFSAELRTAGKWQPEAFVAACETVRGDDGWLRRVQVAEMRALLDWCHSQN